MVAALTYSSQARTLLRLIEGSRFESEAGIIGRALNELYKSIRTRQDFVLFVRALIDDLRENPDSWEHRDLEGFLEALGAWVNDAAPEQADWKLIAAMLLGASAYE
jgi:hypothetical protein